MGKLQPSYPIGSKRILFDNNFYSALKLDNVELVTEPIIGISKSSIKAQGELDKKERQTDIVILATGFRTSDFLLSIEVRGLDNHTLAKDWRQGPEAFFGLAVRRYPNMFMIAGPNSFNPAGSNPEMKEIQVACIMRLLRIKEESQTTIEAKQGEVLKYYSWLGKQINKTVWAVRRIAGMGKLQPSYPIGSKRILFDNNFYSALKLDNVELVTEPIIGISKSSIKTQGELDKKERQTDIVILATGFRTSDFLLSIEVRGLDNHTLAKDWRQGPEAFFGLAVRRYPNMFMIAGPNSFNPAGSNPEMKEIQVACIMRLLRIKEESQTTIEAKQGEVLKYYSWLGKQINKTVWAGPEDSWYG